MKSVLSYARASEELYGMQFVNVQINGVEDSVMTSPYLSSGSSVAYAY